MIEIKTFLTPVFDNSLKTNYYINDDLIIKIELLKTDMAETEIGESDENKRGAKDSISEVVDVEYVDLKNVEEGKTYVNTSLYVKNIKVEDGILFFEVINYISEDAPEESRFPKWITPEKSEFEIPEDAKVIQFEELVIELPEKENDAKQELKKANEKIEQLEAYISQVKSDNEALITSTLEMMVEMTMS